MKRMVPPLVQNQRLRREVRTLLQGQANLLDAALKTADYDRWVESVKSKIGQINARIRASNSSTV